jgi:hypothetical protein
MNTFTKLDALDIAKKGLKVAYDKNNSHSIKANKFLINLLNAFDDNVILQVRASQNSLNIGDVAECLLKHKLNNFNNPSVASRGLKDIFYRIRSEIKCFPAFNRHPNGTAKPKSFYGILDTGVYIVKYKVAKLLWATLPIDSRSDTRYFTLSIMNDLIKNNVIAKDEKLTELLGL